MQVAEQYWHTVLIHVTNLSGLDVLTTFCLSQGSHHPGLSIHLPHQLDLIQRYKLRQGDQKRKLSGGEDGINEPGRLIVIYKSYSDLPGLIVLIRRKTRTIIPQIHQPAYQTLTHTPRIESVSAKLLHFIHKQQWYHYFVTFSNERYEFFSDLMLLTIPSEMLRWVFCFLYQIIINKICCTLTLYVKLKKYKAVIFFSFTSILLEM